MPNQDPANEKLQEALASLRHQAPPRDLHARVRERLAHPEPPPEPTLLQRLGFEVETRPVLIGLAGVLVAALIVAGILAARHVPPPEKPAADAGGNGLPGHLHPPGMGQSTPPLSPGAAPGAKPPFTQPVLATPAGHDRVPLGNGGEPRPPAPPPRQP